jgi:hypothetical protein
MSRPPNTPDHTPNQLCSAYPNNNRGGLIDFVNVPMSLNSQAYGSPYTEVEAFHPSIYAQAGFPGYAPTPMMGGMAQLGAQVSQVFPMQPMPLQPMAIAAPAYLPSAVMSSSALHELAAPVDEDDLHERINSKIDSIIATHKNIALNSKIESLSSKVEQLSHNISHHNTLAQETQDAVNIHRLSDKVQQLSQSLEVANEQRRLQAHLDSRHGDKMDTPFLMQSPYSPTDPRSERAVHVSAEPSDIEISRRLRRLAAESSMRQRETEGIRIPDW